MAASPEQVKLSWDSIGLVILPIAAFLAFEWLLDLYAQVPFHVPAGSSELPCPPNPELAPVFTSSKAADMRWPEAAARLQLLAMMSLYSLFAFGAIFKFGWDLHQLFYNSAGIRLLTAYVTCVGVGVLFFLWARWSGALPRGSHFLGPPLFSQALNEAATYGPSAWSVCTFKGQLTFTSVLAVLSVPAFVMGGISCLALFGHVSEKENWIYQTERLKTYLYMSAGLLVLGVLYLRSWTTYPSFLLTGDEKASFIALADTLTMYVGIEFSVILAAYALPVAGLLSQRADKIAAKIAVQEDANQRGATVTSFEVQQLREREDLVFSTTDSLRLIVALVAPLITGALPSLTSAFG